MATTKRGTTRGVKARAVKKTTRAPARKTTAQKVVAKKVLAKKARGKTPRVRKAAVPKARAKTSAAKKTNARTLVAKGTVGAALTTALAALTKKLKAQFARERHGLEERLTQTVREVGLLRHHELRATQFERQLAERDATIAELRRELESQQSAPPAANLETQEGLNFGSTRPVGLDDSDEIAALDDEDDDLS